LVGIMPVMVAEAERGLLDYKGTTLREHLELA
jgi:hypothetical protein